MILRAKNIFLLDIVTKGYCLIDPNIPVKVMLARDVMFTEDMTCNNKNLKEDLGQNAEVKLQPLLTETSMRRPVQRMVKMIS